MIAMITRENPRLCEDSTRGPYLPDGASLVCGKFITLHGFFNISSNSCPSL
jgi:hypothetical protein